MDTLEAGIETDGVGSVGPDVGGAGGLRGEGGGGGGVVEGGVAPGAEG